jgi:hypothetical protein
VPGVTVRQPRARCGQTHTILLPTTISNLKLSQIPQTLCLTPPRLALRNPTALFRIPFLFPNSSSSKSSIPVLEPLAWPNRVCATRPRSTGSVCAQSQLCVLFGCYGGRYTGHPLITYDIIIQNGSVLPCFTVLCTKKATWGCHVKGQHSHPTSK